MADWSNQPSGASRIETSLVTSGVSKRVAIFGIAFVVVVGVIVVVLRVSGPTSVGADTAVRGALVSTLANNTADLVISESIDVEGQIGTAEGSGKCDLQTDACSATLDYNGAPRDSSIVSRKQRGLPTWLVNPTTEGPLGARAITIDVTSAGTIGRIMFTASATQDRTFAIVR